MERPGEEGSGVATHLAASAPRYPVYVISKGRWESRLTSKALEAIGCPYRIVVEPQEHPAYASVIDPAKILVLPFSDLGLGSIPARNWVWEHSIAEGHAKHWILDDNIRCFFRFHRNHKYVMKTPTAFLAVEDFVDRYANVALAGMQYKMFCPDITGHHYKAFNLNRRVYSNILIDNGIPFRWRGRYNEDTDLSLRVLKAGYCTILVNAFLADKIATMRMRGGNTDELYDQTAAFDGRLEMARHLQRQHPDVTKIVWKWGRWQHSVDYSPFLGNKLLRRRDVIVSEEPNDYGIVLVRRTLAQKKAEAKARAAAKAAAKKAARGGRKERRA